MAGVPQKFSTADQIGLHVRYAQLAWRVDDQIWIHRESYFTGYTTLSVRHGQPVAFLALKKGEEVFLLPT